ncbi:MAG: acyl-CoA thioesterase [Rhodobacter sp.]|uniref:acyl-CoA thioesterase n=1 Tax=Pararhodobacter sp. TaxID=2127056 RepID=UPI001DBF378C|nr:acyl-CoA thioesterase [Pararhodobacter sp.]MCB1344110.1 acyl-CoA thioesterase [Paracoccaceae bacterium]MCB1408979.1 acyl-CoA thioesterase [Paracoccaceae bacterium]MCC0073702.1 acyl-CoA thioesterase [Rhodobacter sp.]HPD93154.1 acyl-CoA thioesterase [Pararhodobacter sp.]
MLSNTLTRRVEWGDCDPAGIVFNPQVFRWFDHGTTMLYEAAGWPKQQMLVHFGAAGCPLVDTRASFKAPVRYGDDVAITSEIAALKTRSFDIRHRLIHDGRLCVEGFETRVWTVKDGARGLIAAPIPDDLRARFLGQAP